MRVVVVLNSQAASEMQSFTRGGANEAVRVGAGDLQAMEEELGVSLTPMYPGQSHPTLTPYYFIDVPDQTTAERLIAGLTQSTLVDAAYVQPDAEPPG
jgi:hypothetical protein